MATGNLFLGTARKKVGDIVLYRRNGVQQARARVRSIANPRSVGQSLQRNYLAPVSRFYAPLSGVLERSFEGLNRSESHNAFTKKNLELARANGWFVPKGNPFIPLPYQLSRGTLTPLSYEVTEVGSILLYTQQNSGDDRSWGRFSQILIGMGYAAGDQITFVGVLADPNSDEFYPEYCRANLDPVSTLGVSDVLKSPSIALQCPSGDYVMLSGDDNIVAGAFIISRYESGKWRRSSQVLAVDADLMSRWQGDAAYRAMLESYGQTSGVPLSDVYLNNGTSSSESVREVLAVISYLGDGNVRERINARPVSFETAGYPVTLADGTTADALCFNGLRTNDNTTVVVPIVITMGGETVSHYIVTLVDGTFTRKAISQDEYNSITAADYMSNTVGNNYQVLVDMGMPASVFQ